MAKILLLEDDPDIAQSTQDILIGNHHVVELANTVSAAFDLLAVSDFDLMILDWNLPDGEGIEVLRDYRGKDGLAPILMLTAKSTIDDKELGFTSGADDYLTKPFSSRELAMRIDALLRRPREIVDQLLTVKHITIECKAGRTLKNGEEVRLLPKEFAVLEFLMRHTGQYYSADQLLDRVWKTDSESMRETVISTINRLRNKIDEAGKPSIIENMRGVGYRIVKD